MTRKTTSAAAAVAAATDASAPATARATKSAAVIALLRRNEGATLAELIAATGWLPHTTRAALTGLRKKGHAIERSKRDELSCYRIAAEGAVSLMRTGLRTMRLGLWT